MIIYGHFVAEVLGLLFCVVSSVTCSKIALVNIDVQNCFVEGGTLAVSGGGDVVPVINTILAKHKNDFAVVVYTQDWHPADHVSFASQHPGFDAYQNLTLFYNEAEKLCKSDNVNASYAVECDQSEISYRVPQTLWPDHCVINTTDASHVATLNIDSDAIVVRKGYNRKVDSYSTFFDNGLFSSTNLDTILQEHGIDTVFLTGIATDYCVYWSAKDAKSLDYDTYVIEDATRGIAQDTVDAALVDMKEKGINVINSANVTSVVEELTKVGPGSACGCISINIGALIIALTISLKQRFD